jgi:hypothetical protein
MALRVMQSMQGGPDGAAGKGSDTIRWVEGQTSGSSSGCGC